MGKLKEQIMAEAGISEIQVDKAIAIVREYIVEKVPMFASVIDNFLI